MKIECFCEALKRRKETEQSRINKRQIKYLNQNYPWETSGKKRKEKPLHNLKEAIYELL